MFRQRCVGLTPLCGRYDLPHIKRSESSETGVVGPILDTLPNASRAKISHSMHSWVYAPQDTVSSLSEF